MLVIAAVVVASEGSCPGQAVRVEAGVLQRLRLGAAGIVGAVAVGCWWFDPVL